jgi:hypothetical protein
MFFANENREKVREENPGIKFGKLSFRACRALVLIFIGEVGKILGEKWKELTDKEKIVSSSNLPCRTVLTSCQPYEKKAQTDKERYETEKARYNAVSPIRVPLMFGTNYSLQVGWR